MEHIENYWVINALVAHFAVGGEGEAEGTPGKYLVSCSPFLFLSSSEPFSSRSSMKFLVGRAAPVQSSGQRFSEQRGLKIGADFK